MYSGDGSNYRHKKRDALGCGEIRLGRSIREENQQSGIAIRESSYVVGFARNRKIVKKKNIKPVPTVSDDVHYNRNYDVGPHSVVYTPRVVRALYRPLDETT